MVNEVILHIHGKWSTAGSTRLYLIEELRQLDDDRAIRSVLPTVRGFRRSRSVALTSRKFLEAHREIIQDLSVARLERAGAWSAVAVCGAVFGA